MVNFECDFQGNFLQNSPANYTSFNFLWHVITIYYATGRYRALITRSWMTTIVIIRNSTPVHF